jgi:iron complex transport system substrate-binding protein
VRGNQEQKGRKNVKHLGIIHFIAVTAFLALSWECLAGPITVRDSSGARVVLREPACRIVSTVPSNTEILYALGLKDQVVGVTKYCAKTCDTKGKVVIGGWVDPDCQKILDLKPDLIFAFGGIQGKWHDRLRDIAPTYCFDPTTLEDTLQAVLDIGRLTNRDQKATEIVRQQREVLARVQATLSAVPPKERLRIARVFGTNTTVRTVGRRSFLTDVIKLAGGVNVFGDVDDDYFQITFERLVSADPDVLLVQGERKDQKKTMDAFRESPEFSKLMAVRHGRVLVYSCDYICHANAAIADTVEMIARGLYQGIFQEHK